MMFRDTGKQEISQRTENGADLIAELAVDATDALGSYRGAA